MTMSEYEIYMEASELRKEDARLNVHEQAWAHQIAKATKGKGGSPMYDKFGKFYGNAYEKSIKRIQKHYEPDKFAAEVEKSNERASKYDKRDLNILAMINGNGKQE